MPFLIVALILAVVVYRLHRRLVTTDRAHREEVEEYIDLAGAMLVVVGCDARIRSANRKACDVLGRPVEDLIGQDWFATVTSAKDREPSRQAFERILAGNVPRGRSERHVVRPDGTERLVEWEFATRNGADGQVLNVLVSGQDVTERRAIETRLAGLHRVAQDVAANEDARQLLVDHAYELLGACSVTLVEGDAVTASLVADGGPGSEPVRMPIEVDGEAIAHLDVGWPDAAQGAGVAQWELLSILALEMASALSRLKLIRSLEQKATRDVLTGAPNRRALEDELPRMLARAVRSGEPVSVAAMDLNAFKALNDTQGHDAGDRALKACAAAWTAELRTTDMLVRLGGDEFLALLPDCPADQSAEVAERLRKATPHQGGSSVGVVTWQGETGDALLRRADEALYADKALCRTGRLADPARLAAVARTGMVRGEVDPALDEITRTTQWLMNVPTATVNLLEAERLAFASHCGLAPELAGDGGTPNSESFCQLAVVTGDPLIIQDTRIDLRVAGHPAIADGVLAYAGIPLTDEESNVLGVLCVFDGRPRAWTDTEIGTLKTLGERAASRLSERAAERDQRSAAGHAIR